ncbi:MAG: ribosome-recycling factor [Patescibacteria group bacterium]
MDIPKELDSKLKVLIESLKQELSNIRTNRPSAKLVENVKVNYMEQQFSIKQLGSISIVPPREIDISCWDKNAAGSVAKAIENSGLGVSAAVDGSLVRVNLPILTNERRTELTKLVKSMTEQSRIKIRALRDDANKKAEQSFKEKLISEDQKFKTRKQVQDAVDKINQETETLLLSKLKELSE